MTHPHRLLLLLALTVTACDSNADPDAATPADAETPLDAGALDAGPDATTAPDAGSDAGPSCDGICGRGTCDVSSGVPVCTCPSHLELDLDATDCRCPIGYAENAAMDACELDVLPSATDFTDPRWAFSGGARVDSTTGYAVIDGAAACMGSVSTLATFPASSERPLVLDVSYTVGDCSSSGCSGTRPNLYVTVDGRPLPLPRPDAGSYEESFCLGSAFLTGSAVTVEMGLRTFDSTCTSTDGWLEGIRDLSVRVADPGECPTEVGFEASEPFVDASAPGWTITPANPSGPTDIYGVVLDAGGNYFSLDSSSSGVPQGVRLSYTTEVPTPAAGSGIALAIETRTVGPMEYGFGIGPGLAPTLEGGEIVDHSTAVRDLFCVPAWAYGTIQPLRVSLGVPVRWDGTMRIQGLIELRDVDLVDEPRCAMGGVLASDLERDRVGWWPLVRAANLHRPSVTRASELVGTATNHYLHLAVDRVCSGASVRQSVLVPSSGTQLRFRYRTAGAGRWVRLGGPRAAFVSLADATDWTTQTVCLPPGRLAGTIDIELGIMASGTCDVASTAFLDLDDVEIIDGGPCTPPPFD